MSSRRSKRDAEFEALGIPLALNYLSSDKTPCNSGCRHCHGSKPGCKTTDFQRDLDFILRMLRDDSSKYGGRFAWNRGILHAFQICRFAVSRSLASQSFYSEIFETERRLRLMSELEKIHNLYQKICCVSAELQHRVNRLFLVNPFGKTQKERGLILTWEQWQVVMPWLSDDFPFVPMPVMQKSLMLSMGVGFLIQKFAPIEMSSSIRVPMHLQLMIFKRIFSERLVRKQDSGPLRPWDHLTMKGFLTQFDTAE